MRTCSCNKYLDTHSHDGFLVRVPRIVAGEPWNLMAAYGIPTPSIHLVLGQFGVHFGESLVDLPTSRQRIFEAHNGPTKIIKVSRAGHVDKKEWCKRKAAGRGKRN